MEASAVFGNPFPACGAGPGSFLRGIPALGTGHPVEQPRAGRVVH